jgi:hypothetical protein
MIGVSSPIIKFIERRDRDSLGLNVYRKFLNAEKARLKNGTYRNPIYSIGSK